MVERDVHHRRNRYIVIPGRPTSFIVDTPRNREAYGKLVDLIGSGTALGFIGAGVTAELQYPTWKELVEYLADQVRQLRGNEINADGLSLTVDAVMGLPDADLLAKAQIFKQSLGEKYFEIMGQLFGPKERRLKPISDLVALPFKHLLTSNYDPSLEDHHVIERRPPWICLHQESEVRTFIQDFQHHEYPRHVVHVHGRYNEPEFIVLTERDYAAYIQPVVERFWVSVPVTGRFVFIGWSFNDADLNQNFRRFEMIFKEAKPKAARHFAVVPLERPESEGAQAAVLKMKYGIEPVFYPHPDRTYAEYTEFITILKSEVLGDVPEQLAQEVQTTAYVAQPSEISIPEKLPQPSDPTEVRLGIERLNRMTRSNIEKRGRPGELQ